MDSNWFIQHVIEWINGRKVIPYTILDDSGIINPNLRQILGSRLQWITSLTWVQFIESSEPYLTFNRVNQISPYRTFFSQLDISHLQQIHGIGNPIQGTKNADVLKGTPGPDVIIGGGPDKISGGWNAYWLIGGGKDTFIAKPSLTPYGYDLIEDFSKKDFIMLKGGLDVNNIDIRKYGADTWLWSKGNRIAYLPDTQFFDTTYIV